MSRALQRLALLTVLCALATACSDPGEPASDVDPVEAPSAQSEGQRRDGPPGARWGVVEMLRKGARSERHPADRGGRAWLEREPDAPPLHVGDSGRFPIVFEVGPEGIATDGGIFLQVSPFWGWSTPQVQLAAAPGYTEVVFEGDSEGVDLEAETLGDQLLGIRNAGRALEPGERLRITYGAGAAGARVDRYAERQSRFWIAVDGDGDGVRETLPDSPGIDVLAGPPAQLRVVVPTVARPGERVPVKISLLDAIGNAGVAADGEVRIDDPGPGLEVPGPIALREQNGARATAFVVPREPGVYRLRATGPLELSAESNPMLVAAEGPLVLWADLHGHSGLSDGTGTADDYFSYARDVAGLDVVALTDHDHWGMLPLDKNPDRWRHIEERTRHFNEPGRFVTLLGYEWTNWIHGHRHVLYFGDEGEIFSSIDLAYESPIQLWQALEGHEALTIAHHSAGGPIPINWEIPPDPRFEPVTEIVSVHGSSEAPDSPVSIYSPLRGNFVRDALDRGYRFGFVGSGDSHDGHPGLPQLAAGTGLGGVAAILSEERTRAGVFAALRARRSYATNGPRILLRVALGGHGMGSLIPAPEAGGLAADLYVRAIAPEPLERIDLIRSGAVLDSLALEGRREVELQREVAALASGEYLYVRVVQTDGGAAWSSPFYIE